MGGAFLVRCPLCLEESKDINRANPRCTLCGFDHPPGWSGSTRHLWSVRYLPEYEPPFQTLSDRERPSFIPSATNVAPIYLANSIKSIAEIHESVKPENPYNEPEPDGPFLSGLRSSNSWKPKAGWPEFHYTWKLAMYDSVNHGDFKQSDTDIHNYLKLEIYNTTYPYPARFETESQFAGRMLKHYGSGSAQYKLSGELYWQFFETHDELPQAQIPFPRVAPAALYESNTKAFEMIRQVELRTVEEWEKRERWKRELEGDAALSVAHPKAVLSVEGSLPLGSFAKNFEDEAIRTQEASVTPGSDEMRKTDTQGKHVRVKGKGAESRRF